MAEPGTQTRRARALAGLAAAVLALATTRGPATADLDVATLSFAINVDPPTPEVGDVVSVAFDISADGVAGLQHYELSGAQDLFAGDFVPEHAQTFFPDRVVFELTALRPGVTELTLNVNYEAQHCDGESCFYAFRNQASDPIRIRVAADGELPRSDLRPTRMGQVNGVPTCPPGDVYVCFENRDTAPAERFQLLLHVVGGESAARYIPEVGPGQEICIALERVGEGGIAPDEPGGQLEVIVDSMDEVDETDEGNNRAIFDIPEPFEPPGGCPTPTPTPSANLGIDPAYRTLPCLGAFDVSIAAEGSRGASISVQSIWFHHAYSQGFYGQGFTWDLSSIALPFDLATGDHLTIPIAYHPQGFDSRLHLDVEGIAPNGTRVTASAVYAGYRCQTPPPTPTFTPTATPLPSGDFGDVSVEGVVYDAVAGDEVRVGAAQVTFRIPAQAPSYGTTLTDAAGRFTFRQRLHEGDTVEVRVDAPGYLVETRTFSAETLLEPIEIAVQPIDGDCCVLTPTATPTSTPTQGEFSVYGTVYDRTIGRDAGGIAGASVSVSVDSTGDPSVGGNGFTDSDGRFQFTLFHLIRPSDVIEIRVEAPHYFTTWYSVPATALSEPQDVELGPLPKSGDPLGLDSALCAVDCNDDLEVDVGELVTGVAIAIGRSRLERCAAADADGDRRVSVGDLIGGVNNALDGCRAGHDSLGPIDQAWTGPHGGSCGIDVESYSPASHQEFVPTAPRLSGVAVVIYRGSTPRNWPIELRVRAGSEEGPVIGTASADVWVYYANWIVFQFASPLDVTPGEKYVIELSTTSPYFQWLAARGVGPDCAPSSYTAGDAFPVRGSDTGIDFLFATIAGD